LEQLQAVLRYTVQTLEGRWEMSAEEISEVVIKTRWGPCATRRGAKVESRRFVTGGFMNFGSKAA
jgi:hypothetical protein